jgi:hypothetical protein
MVSISELKRKVSPSNVLEERTLHKLIDFLNKVDCDFVPLDSSRLESKQAFSPKVDEFASKIHIFLIKSPECSCQNTLEKLKHIAYDIQFGHVSSGGRSFGGSTQGFISISSAVSALISLTLAIIIYKKSKWASIAMWILTTLLTGLSIWMGINSFKKQSELVPEIKQKQPTAEEQKRERLTKLQVDEPKRLLNTRIGEWRAKLDELQKGMENATKNEDKIQPKVDAQTQAFAKKLTEFITQMQQDIAKFPEENKTFGIYLGELAILAENQEKAIGTILLVKDLPSSIFEYILGTVQDIINGLKSQEKKGGVFSQLAIVISILIVLVITVVMIYVINYSNFTIYIAGYPCQDQIISKYPNLWV